MSVNQDADHMEDKTSISYFRRLCSEFRLPIFGVMEVDGKQIDIPASFSPEPYLWICLMKFALTGISVGILIQDWLAYTEPDFYMAYLTHWSYVVALAYMVVSLFISLFRCAPSSDEKGPGFMVCLAWALFGLGGTNEIVVTLLFWTLDYEPGSSITFYTVYMHGIFMVVVLLEGLVINRVPVRMKHIVFVYIYQILYSIWSIIHSQTDIGNPVENDNDPETDDDAIYPSLNWNKRPESSAATAVVSILVVSPLLFLLLWSLSLYSCPFRFDGSRRRYTKKEESHSGPNGV